MPRQVSRFPVSDRRYRRAQSGSDRPLALAAHATGPVDRSDAPARRTGCRARYHHAGSGQSVAEPSFGGPAELSPAMRDALRSLPSNDTVLANTLRQVPSVIARAALADGKPKSESLAKQTPVIIVGRIAAALSAILPGGPRQYSGDRSSGFRTRLRQRYPRQRRRGARHAAGASQSTARPAPALALEILRVATGEKQYSVRSDPSGVVGVQIGDSFIPTDRDGRVRLYFSPAYAARRISAAAILSGEVKPGALR